MIIRGKTIKNSPQIPHYTKLTQTTGPNLSGQKLNGRKNSNVFKERILVSLKLGKRRTQKEEEKKLMKRQRYYMNKGTN